MVVVGQADAPDKAEEEAEVEKGAVLVGEARPERPVEVVQGREEGPEPVDLGVVPVELGRGEEGWCEEEGGCAPGYDGISGEIELFESG